MWHSTFSLWEGTRRELIDHRRLISCRNTSIVAEMYPVSPTDDRRDSKTPLRRTSEGQSVSHGDFRINGHGSPVATCDQLVICHPSNLKAAMSVESWCSTDMAAIWESPFVVFWNVPSNFAYMFRRPAFPFFCCTCLLFQQSRYLRSLLTFCHSILSTNLRNWGLPVNMSQSQGQLLPSLQLAQHSDQQRAILSNLSYPSRPNSHICWSRSSVPLRFAVDVRSNPTLAFSYASATANDPAATDNHVITNGHITTNDDTDDNELYAVTHVFRHIRNLIWHELLIFSGKLKQLARKLISAQAAPLDPSLWSNLFFLLSFLFFPSGSSQTFCFGIVLTSKVPLYIHLNPFFIIDVFRFVFRNKKWPNSYTPLP